MAELLLSNGMKAKVDDAMYDRLSQFKWQPMAREKCLYARRSYRGKDGKTKGVLLHHEIMGSSSMVDHIDGDGLNNLRENLRSCTHSENMRNRRKFKIKTSEYKGVSWKKTHQKWDASIRVNGTLIPLGYFNNELEAAETYNLAAPLFFGQFARINKV